LFISQEFYHASELETYKGVIALEIRPRVTSPVCLLNLGEGDPEQSTS
jgi:hypothetical protein